MNKVSFLFSFNFFYKDHFGFQPKLFFQVLKAGTWGGRGETALFGDLGVKDITKAHAIDVLLEHLQADKKDTIAFGDAKLIFQC